MMALLLMRSGHNIGPELFDDATGGSIPGGTNVWIEKNDNDGQWYVTSVDCEN